MIDRLIRTIAEELEVVPETLDEVSSMETVKPWDSLGHLNVILAVEEAFGVRFPPERIPQLRSVAALRLELERAAPAEAHE